MSKNHTGLARIATTLAAVGVLTLAAGVASADPNYDPDANGGAGAGTTGTFPVGKTDPQIYAGVGADAFAELTNNFASHYNADVAPGPADPVIASYDAVDPVSGATGPITTKPGCTLTRPNGANGGLGAILNDQLAAAPDGDGTSFCIDFVRASRGRDTSASGHAGEGNLTFFEQSRDGVGYATVGNAYAPTTPLSRTDLKGIFECTITDWSQVGGQAGAIHVYRQPDTAATWTFFLKAIGSSLPSFKTGCGDPASGPSNSTPSQQNDGRTLEGDPQGIAGYAITKWAAQANHAPAVRDYRGGAALGLIAATAPGQTLTSPLTVKNLNGTDYQVLNPAFATSNPEFVRLFYNAVRNGAPQAVKDLFDTTSYLCTHADDLLVPYGNDTLGSNTGASRYCGKAD